jgi:hypothetical protein
MKNYTKTVYVIFYNLTATIVFHHFSIFHKNVSLNVTQCIADASAIGYNNNANKIGGSFMMAKTASLNIRIDPETKSSTEKLF